MARILIALTLAAALSVGITWSVVLYHPAGMLVPLLSFLPGEASALFYAELSLAVLVLLALGGYAWSRSHRPLALLFCGFLIVSTLVGNMRAIELVDDVFSFPSTPAVSLGPPTTASGLNPVDEE